MDQLIFWSFLVLLFKITSGEVAGESPVVATVKDECCSSNLMDRVSQLEAKDKHQEEEITFLKTTVLQLKGRVKTLEAEVEESAVGGVITRQAKRPSRLIPLWY